jgi:hypothetical protein
MGAAPKLHEHDALRAAHDRVSDALRELANLRDDHGLPTMALDNMRREVTALKARLPANDNR